MFNRMTTLWMGDLDPHMDDSFIKQAFSKVGETVYGVKIIRVTVGSSGYCFVEMADEASVDRCVQRLNGKMIPDSNPPRKFKVNYAASEKRPEPGPQFSVFVGDLTSEVDDYQLHQFFLKKFPTCKGAKVVTDPYGNSRGYGFVRFGNKSDQKKALEQFQNASGLGGKLIRISVAVSKSNKSHSNYHSQSHNYNYQQPNQNYYPQWGYDQQYNNSYGNYGYGHYGNPPPHGMPPQPLTAVPDDMQPAMEQLQESVEVTEEDATEDPNPSLDVGVLNRKYMERSEELYDAMMSCYW